MTASAALREQRIVGVLDERLAEVSDQDLEKLRPRALDLPAMLRRHGPLQVLRFLEARQGSELAGHLEAGIRAALGDAPGDAAPPDFSRMELPVYLLYWEASVEAASWLKRLVEARPKPVPGAGDLSGTQA